MRKEYKMIFEAQLWSGKEWQKSGRSEKMPGCSGAMLVVEILGASTVILYGLNLIRDPLYDDFEEDLRQPGTPKVSTPACSIGPVCLFRSCALVLTCLWSLLPGETAICHPHPHCVLQGGPGAPHDPYACSMQIRMFRCQKKHYSK